MSTHLHVKATRGNVGDIESCTAQTAQRMRHLAALLGVKSEVLERLDLGRQSRRRTRAAILDANAVMSVGTTYFHLQSLAERVERLGLAGQGEASGLVEEGAAALGSRVELVKKGVVNNTDDGHAAHSQANGRSDHGEAMDLSSVMH